MKKLHHGVSLGSLILTCMGCGHASPTAIIEPSSDPESVALRTENLAAKPISGDFEAGDSIQGSMRVAPLERGMIRDTLVYDGLTRSYTLYIPTNYRQQRTLALVIALHGLLGTGDGMMDLTGLNYFADQDNFIVVYPDAVEREWNSRTDPRGPDDVGYLKTLIDQLQTHYPINPDWVFVTGLSNGGRMAYQLACDQADVVTAIAPVATSLDVDTACQPVEPVSVMAFHGLQDRIVPYGGGVSPFFAPLVSPEELVDYLPVPETLLFWSDVNECLTRSSEITSTGTRQIADPCARNTRVELFTIADGGHVWPTFSNSALSATATMVEFFKSHTKLQ